MPETPANNHQLEEALKNASLLKRSSRELAESIAQLQRANAEIKRSRRAALNVLEDSILSKKALQASEEKYRLLFESIDEGFCIIEVLFDENEVAYDYRFIEANKAFEKQTGLTNVVGKTMKKIRLAHEQLWFDIYGKVAKTGEPERFENEAKALGYYYEVYAFRTGKPHDHHVAILFNDITERKKAEQRQAYLLKLADALRQSNDPLEIEKTAAQMLGRHLNVARALYARISEDGEYALISSNYTDGVSPFTGKHRLKDFGPAFIRTLQDGKTLVIPDIVNSNMLTETEKKRYAAIDIAAQLVVSLRKNNRFVLALGVYQKNPRNWTGNEIALVEETAERSWVAIEKASAETALREKEAELDAIINETPFMLTRCTRDLHYRYVSRAYAAMVNRTPEEVNGKAIIEVIGEEGWRTIAPYVERVLHGEYVEYEDEVDFLKANKPYLKVVYSPDRDPVGNVVGWFASIVDITERKQAEKALRESEARLANELEDTKQLQQISSRLIEVDNIQSLYDKILDVAMSIMDSDMGSMQMLVPEKNELLLLTCKGFHPQSAAFWKWVNADQTSAFGIALAKQERTFIPDVEESELIESSRELHHFRLSNIRSIQSTPLISRDGKIVGMISTQWKEVHTPSERELGLLDVLARQAADLMERKNAEQALRESEERLRITTETAVDFAIINTNTKGLVEGWNSGAERIFGFKAKEIIGKPVDVIFTEEDRAAHVPEKEMATARERELVEDERWHCRKDGSRLYVSGVMRPMYNPHLVGYVKIARDMTEQKLLEQQKDDFIGIASHELKTPVTTIKAYAEYLKEILYEEGNREDAQLVEKLNVQVDRLSELIRSLLDTTRISEGQVSLAMEEFDVNELIRERIEELQHTTENHRLIFDPTGKINITADSERISQVLINLISNAIKYSPKGGEITIVSEGMQGGVQVSVHDQGVGISPEIKDKIFERFYRVRNAQIDTFPGMGLGLYIAASIVKRHEGKIWVESEPGKGSTFYFWLPYQKS